MPVSHSHVFFGKISVQFFCWFFFFLSFCLFRATLMACGNSQARGPIGARAAGLSHSQSNAGSGPRLQPTPQLQKHGIQAASATYTTVHSNAGSLTQWARPGIEPTSSWMLVGFINHWAMTGTPRLPLMWSTCNLSTDRISHLELSVQEEVEAEPVRCCLF